MSEESVCAQCGSKVLSIDVDCAQCGMALSSTGAQRMIGSVVLDNYEVIGILGQGGMSVVYKGKHRITGQEVALKVLPPKLAAYRDLKGRFLEEGRALAQMDHPNIVHLYNFGDDGDCLVLAMQYVKGVTWERLIVEQGIVDWRESAKLAADVADALAYAHSQGIVHRDMKPSNVLVRDLDGAGTVMDFGIAKRERVDKLTATGQTMGTVHYMSPEQVQGLDVGVYSDIYSLAVTLYESLAGVPPFDGETHFEVMTKHLSEVPMTLSQRGVELPPALEKIVMKGLAKLPEDRQSSAAELRDEIRDVLGIIPMVRPALSRSESGVRTPSLGLAKTEANLPYGVAEEMSGSGNTVRAGRKGQKGSRRIAVGVAMIVGLGLVGMYLAVGGSSRGDTQDQEEPGTLLAEKAAVPEAVSQTVILEKAFVLPGLEFTQDQIFPEAQLRILTTGVEAVEVKNMVLEAIASLQEWGKEQAWPNDKVIPLPLSVAIIPSIGFCNPQLFESGKVPEKCHEMRRWYRPKERSLYVLSEESSMEQSLLYGLASVCCLHGVMPGCEEAIFDKFEK